MGKEIHKFIDLSKLPRNYKGIDWINTIGYKVYFEYDDIKDWIEIINYIKEKNELYFEYNNNKYFILTDNLKKCKLGRILNKQTNDFKIEIGTTFKDEKRDITIIDRKYRKTKRNQNMKYYKYKCNKCGFDGGRYYCLKNKQYKEELWTEESNLLKHKTGCPCCCNPSKIVVKGINDIATTNPELIKYFVNKEDVYTHTIGSGDKIKFKCENCDFIKCMSINNFYSINFNCPKCGDGISYPEKFMINLLEQLFNNKFIYQYSSKNSKWCNKYKYDFYFKYNNEEYIIETHGGQHYCNKTKFKRTLEEEQQNDKNKYNLAILNGIKPNNYIVIDCRYSNFDFIKNNIINSRLNEIFDLHNICWNYIEENSQKSLVKEVCNYWHLHVNINNEELTVTDLENIFNLKKDTIRRYIKQGDKLNWCYYNNEEEERKRVNKIKKLKNCSKTVEIFKDDISLGIFISCAELERQSKELFGKELYQDSISAVCRGNIKTYRGYTFKYISREEYERRISEDPTLKESEQAS